KAAPAATLHDKVLHADADMNRADWKTGVATIVGVAGIGLGFWWADAVAALLGSASVIRDGDNNTRVAMVGLTDARPTPVDGGGVHPLVHRVDRDLADVPWGRDHGARLRDEGHVFHVEAYLVPAAEEDVSVDRLAAVRRRLTALNWKTADAVVTGLSGGDDHHRPGSPAGRSAGTPA